ncbi:MAG: hypothetical protein U0350_51575 [Caldilineaceae bacterium]
MRYWTWQIPEIYVAYLTQLGLDDHPLYADFRKTQYIEQSFLPRAFEIYPDVFLWRNHGHRLIYERLTNERVLLLTSIERM